MPLPSWGCAKPPMRRSRWARLRITSSLPRRPPNSPTACTSRLHQPSSGTVFMREIFGSASSRKGWACTASGRTVACFGPAAQAAELTDSLHKSFAATFKRNGLYEGNLWFGVEPEGVGMYGFWAHCCLLWPCRALDPHDPMLSATWRKMEQMSQSWGGGLFSESQGGYWPYIGVDWALSYILRGEPR